MSAPLVLIVLSRHQCVIYEFSENAALIVIVSSTKKYDGN